jgi:hypothetical protein
MTTGFLLGGLELLLLLFLAPVALAAFVFWIWMLIHCIRNDSLRDVEKLIWALVILFLHFLGGLLYFFFGRKPRGAELAR